MRMIAFSPSDAAFGVIKIILVTICAPTDLCIVEKAFRQLTEERSVLSAFHWGRDLKCILNSFGDKSLLTT